jgi:hypothetical protein
VLGFEHDTPEYLEHRRMALAEHDSQHMFASRPTKGSILAAAIELCTVERHAVYTDATADNPCARSVWLRF